MEWMSGKTREIISAHLNLCEERERESEQRKKQQNINGKSPTINHMRYVKESKKSNLSTNMEYTDTYTIHCHL